MIPDDLKQYDYRGNIIIDKDNPILVWKAWRDRYSKESHWKVGYGGQAYLSRANSEDALTWNVFRSLQLSKPELISKISGISEVEKVLFWGCDVEYHGEEQQILNILIRITDGRYEGTMTEPDLVIITKGEVVFVECKLNQSGKSSPWKAPDKKDEAKIDGADKRFAIYKEMLHELMYINDWRNVYQLIRQCVYAKLLSCHLGKKPLVIPIINEKHKDILCPYYSKLRNSTEINKNVFKDFITWQDIRQEISESDLSEKECLLAKIDKALSEASRKQRKRDMSVFDEIRKLNKGTDPEELEKDIQEAIQAVRSNH